MALQFFAVHSDALAHTHDALHAHATSLGRKPPGPTRALRVAQLYGHLQLRAAGRPAFTLALCELAATWRLQPRQLRQDLALLHALGWLKASGTSRGTVIELHPSELSDEPPVLQPTIPYLHLEDPPPQPGRARGAEGAAGDKRRHGPTSRGLTPGIQPPPPSDHEQSAGTTERLPATPHGSPSPQAAQEAPQGRLDPANDGKVPPVASGPSEGLLEAAGVMTHSGLDPRPGKQATQPTPQPTSADPLATATQPEPSASKGPRQATPGLLQHMAALYNTHRPPTWPAYQLRGNGLRAKLRQALQQAGDAEALAATLVAALRAVPPFWRHTYPVGRSGAECMAVLFATDRSCAGLGVEFWHLFTWAQAGEAAAQASTSAEATAGSSGHGAAEDPLSRAQRLFLWDSGIWRGQGREALLLSPAQKRELTLLLEAHGHGIAGTAERQFAETFALEGEPSRANDSTATDSRLTQPLQPADPPPRQPHPEHQAHHVQSTGRPCQGATSSLSAKLHPAPRHPASPLAKATSERPPVGRSPAKRHQVSPSHPATVSLQRPSRLASPGSPRQAVAKPPATSSRQRPPSRGLPPTPLRPPARAG